jgi:hypothetical protein
VIVVLTLFATQVVFDLYARSAVTSAAVEAARSVAGFASAEAYGSPSGPGAASSEQMAVAIAESRARAALGRYGKVTTFAWRFLPTDGAPTAVELNVRFDASASGFDLTRPLALPGLNRFDRTVRVRVEHITCPAMAPCRVVSGTGSGGSP